MCRFVRRKFTLVTSGPLPPVPTSGKVGKSSVEIKDSISGGTVGFFVDSSKDHEERAWGLNQDDRTVVKAFHHNRHFGVCKGQQSCRRISG